MTPEKRVQNECLSYLQWKRKHDILIFTNRSTGIFDPVKKTFRTNRDPYFRPGVADTLGIYRNRPLAIEFKAGKNKQSPSQKAFQADWEHHRGIYLLIYSLNQLVESLQLLDERNPLRLP